MARRTTQPPEPPAEPELKVPVNSAREQILNRIALGDGLLNNHREDIRDQSSLDAAEKDFRRWDAYNTELLRRLFSTDRYSTEYSWAGPSLSVNFGGKPLGAYIEEHLQTLADKIENLHSLADRLELIPVAQGVENIETQMVLPAATPADTLSSNRVFVVHGHDNETKAVVARFLTTAGLEPVILHEMPDQGSTIIEKFERNTDVAFAVVLLTPDDVGSTVGDASDPSKLRARARQNVILELGFFTAKLGRGRVCALRKGDVEVPSDFSGVIYTEYDGASEGWKMKLIRELKAAGLKVNVERALL